MLSLEAK